MAEARLETLGIDHVVLHVKEMARTLAFYVDLLGFKIRHLDDDGTKAFLGCGEQGLDLFETDEQLHTGAQMNHMAIRVGGDLDGIVSTLTQAGVETSGRTRRGTVFVLDPDGHRLEMLPAVVSPRVDDRDRAEVSA